MRRKGAKLVLTQTSKITNKVSKNCRTGYLTVHVVRVTIEETEQTHVMGCGEVGSVANLVSEILDLVSPKDFGMT